MVEEYVSREDGDWAAARVLAGSMRAGASCSLIVGDSYRKADYLRLASMSDLERNALLQALREIDLAG